MKQCLLKSVNFNKSSNCFLNCSTSSAIDSNSIHSSEAINVKKNFAVVVIAATAAAASAVNTFLQKNVSQKLLTLFNQSRDVNMMFKFTCRHYVISGCVRHFADFHRCLAHGN